MGFLVTEMSRGLHTNDKLAFICMATVVALLCAFYAEFFVPESYIHSGDAIYITEANIFRACFKEPFERLVFVMKDGNSITYTTHHETSVRASYPYFRSSLRKKGYEISDIIYCIHNHLTKPFFSEGDVNFCRHMRNDGFVGIFALYCQPSRKVIIYEN